MRVGLATEDRRRSRATFRTKVVGALAAMLVLPIAAGLTTAGTAAAAPAPAQAAPAATQNPTGAAVTKVDWLSERRVALWVNSPAMGTPIQVQILLARDWNVNPSASFPSVWMLDGLRATDNENAWTYETDAESFYADKNVNVILPVGGQSSFYSDWLQPDNGKNYQWETFLTKELPPILEQDWRTTQTRGVVGLSMGGTSAMFLTARNPGFFKFAASLSGILTTTSLGMPQAIQFAMTDAGGYNSAAMWGPPSNPQWAAHDPYALAEKLKGVSLYVSSGSGTTGPYDQPSGIPGVSTNYAGMGLEILARLTSQTFATKLNQLGIPAQVNYRPSGTHSWPYWQFELHQLWPQLANAIGVEVEKPACGTSGEIGATAAANGWIGDCITPEYSVAGGLAQDFRNGRIYFTSGTGAQPVAGRIAGAYMNTGAAAGPLGFPRTPELGTPDGRGRFNHFQNGSIYWTPQTGAHPVSGDILAEWSAQGWEGGPLGYPTADEIATPGKPGKVQGFEIGAMYSSANGTHAVLGMIMGKYGELGWENGWLGFPKSNEVPIKDNGRFTEFEGGNIYWSPGTGAWSVENGPLFDGWKSVGYEGGRLGFPISDKFDIPGGVQQNFQFGYITVIGDKTEVH
ncbi:MULTISPECIES: alpha/beta hydrolase-fold protein [Rhodococcus]|jgi:S-formylglutathione hydrolase FrmB|uniref:alpha/beta hydrolase-fold protein n=1 Tax=Rhodococcus TaxID=1827 RepID=UPI001E4AFFAC|nr:MULTISPECIES: alpha/beta hydrolase-fold protein [Rhodococcus]MDI9960130.1 alpha/beta hydrolase-fold protein [Rhodococcus sp. IEGM 1237]MDI9966022.1 alpha/beta hydrolase-fold protein [Rhodococcus sp. IEGM 1251]MDV8128310.1 alpha/beta hydrolase-fold protein [Rhodococcus sp. IEGM 1304]UDF21516.1 esterase [Rhodococcus qingshengii]WNF42066.1 alpha/beta hydrolase-fold protein [Rhodococcus sp. SG20037]